MGEDKIIALLQESLNVATRVGAAKPSDFSSFIVDTTVQPKAVELPTHASRPREAGAVGQKAGEPRDYFRKAGADAGKVALRGQGTSRWATRSFAAADRGRGGRRQLTASTAKTRHNGKTSKLFNAIANGTSQAAGRAQTFLIAAGIVVVWAVSGPVFGFSDTWQLVINTGTTIITFLMVFLIQNSQNRDSAAIQVKLDELIRVSVAHNSFVGIEHLTDDELENIRTKCEQRAEAEKAGEAKMKETDLKADRAARRIAS